MMNSLIIGFKREFWEYRKIIIGIPVVISGLVIVAALMAMIAWKHFGDESEEQSNVPASQAEQHDKQNPDAEADALPSSSIDGSAESVQSKDEKGPGLEGDEDDESEFGFMGIYVVIAWLVGIYYLLSSLYTDRKDKSVLYWKSMPVSETRNVLTKFLFGSVGFPAFAVVIAWATSLILMLLLYGASFWIETDHFGSSSDWDFSAIELFVWPLLSLFFGVIWGAPIFAYVMMVSAMSKRSPFILMVVPPIILMVLERILFRSSGLAELIGNHLPFSVLGVIAESPDIGSAFSSLLIGRGADLVQGLIFAAIFIYTAIWYRNNRFEI